MFFAIIFKSTPTPGRPGKQRARWKEARSWPALRGTPEEAEAAPAFRNAEQLTRSRRDSRLTRAVSGYSGGFSRGPPSGAASERLQRRGPGERERRSDLLRRNSFDLLPGIFRRFLSQWLPGYPTASPAGSDRSLTRLLVLFFHCTTRYNFCPLLCCKTVEITSDWALFSLFPLISPSPSIILLSAELNKYSPVVWSFYGLSEGSAVPFLI